MPTLVLVSWEMSTEQSGSWLVVTEAAEVQWEGSDLHGEGQEDQKGMADLTPSPVVGSDWLMVEE